MLKKFMALAALSLADKPLFRKVAAQFLEFVGEGLLVAHNAAFDMKFINHELRACALPIFTPERSFDTVALARKKYPRTARQPGCALPPLQHIDLTGTGKAWCAYWTPNCSQMCIWN